MNLAISLLSLLSVGQEPMQTDFFGDPLPAGAVGRLGTLRFRAMLPCSGLAISPNGSAIAISDRRGFGVMDARSGRWLWPNTNLEYACADISFLSDDLFVCLHSDIRVGSLKKRAFIKSFELPAFRGTGFHHIVLSRDRTLLACGSLNVRSHRMVIAVWNLQTSRRLFKVDLDGRFEFSSAVCFAADGKTLAVGGNADGSIALMDVPSGKLDYTWEAHASEIPSLDFSPTGKMLVSVSHHGLVRLWDYPQKKLIRSFQVAKELGPSFYVRFSPDGDGLLLKDNKGITLRDLKGNVEIKVAEGEEALFHKSNEGLQLLYYAEGAVRFMDLPKKQEIVRVSPIGYIMSLAAFDDERVWICERNQPSRWNWKTGKEETRLASGRTVSLSADRKLLAVGRSKKIEIRDPQSANKLYEVTTEHDVDVLAFSQDGNFLAAAGWLRAEPVVIGFDLETKKEIFRFSGFGSVGAFSPDGSLFLRYQQLPTGTGEILLHDIKTGKSLSDNYDISSAVFSPDGKSAVLGGMDGSIQIREANTLKKTAQFKGHSDTISGLLFSPKGNLLASSSESDFKIRLWNFQDKTLVKEFSAPEGSVRHLSFSPDGRYLASGGLGTTVLIWPVPPKNRKK
jgi:WD40 repeat protein